MRAKYPTCRAIDVKRSLEQSQHTTMVIPWEDSECSGDAIRQATMNIDGFNVYLKVVYDYDYDWLDGRGKFTDKWEVGAIKNPSYRYDNRVYEYFVPDYTEEQQYRDLRKLKYGKSEAREMAHSYVLQVMKIASDPDKEGYYCVAVIANAYKEGIKLGSGSLWGIELAYNDNYDYVSECAIGVAHSAVTEAKENLAKLLISDSK